MPGWDVGVHKKGNMCVHLRALVLVCMCVRASERASVCVCVYVCVCPRACARAYASGRAGELVWVDLDSLLAAVEFSFRDIS